VASLGLNERPTLTNPPSSNYKCYESGKEKNSKFHRPDSPHGRPKPREHRSGGQTSYQHQKPVGGRRGPTKRGVAVSGRTWRQGWAAARPSAPAAGRGAPPTSSAPHRASRPRAPEKGTAGSGQGGAVRGAEDKRCRPGVWWGRDDGDQRREHARHGVGCNPGDGLARHRVGFTRIKKAH
jgi:hypothetical protein